MFSMDQSRSDLCIECLAPTSLHVGKDGRWVGHARALQLFQQQSTQAPLPSPKFNERVVDFARRREQLFALRGVQPFFDIV